MDSSLNQGLSAVNALRHEYDNACVELIRAQTKTEGLEKFITEKESETAQLNTEISHMDEQIILLESQLEATEVTISHYRQSKRYVWIFDSWNFRLRAFFGF